MEDFSLQDFGPHPLTFPIVLNLTGRQVLVVGGGRVGTRKARAALAGGARVRIVDPHADAEAFLRLPTSAEVAYVQERYCSEHLTGVCLVFAAATPEVNARVEADGKRRGVWVNSATNAASDFALPSVIRRGALTLAMSTSGAAPALARRIREKLETDFDGAFTEWVRILGEVRVVVREKVADPGLRRELLDGFANWSWLSRVRAEGAGAVREAMLSIVETFGKR
jgi:precorrin-2 dehydrogenase/sirohydrochlorin ferrochelatase